MHSKNISSALYGTLHNALSKYPEEIRKAAPLIHCITNYVTAGDVANLLLAAGASPLMTDHPMETASAASSADGLVLNLGTLKPSSIIAMIRAGRAAMKKNIPIILDPVGIGLSAYRRYAAKTVLKHVKISIIRGNSSEIRTLANMFGHPVVSEQHGVDAVSVPAQFDADSSDITASVSASFKDRLDTDTRIAGFLSKKLNSVIICTGSCDLVVCGHLIARIKNGCPELARITGSGCMMDGLLAAFAATATLSASKKNPSFYFYPAVCAVTEIGLCGEIAAKRMHAENTGLGSFHTYFMDAVSRMTGSKLLGGQKIETKTK